MLPMWMEMTKLEFVGMSYAEQEELQEHGASTNKQLILQMQTTAGWLQSEFQLQEILAWLITFRVLQYSRHCDTRDANLVIR